MDHTDQDLFIALHRAREAVLDLYRPALAEHGLSEPQWRVLRTLETDGPLDATRLAERTGIQPPSLTRIIRNFDARGLVGTRRNAEDARRLLLTLTPSGRSTAAAMRDRIETVDRQVVTLVGRPEITELCSALNGLRQSVDKGRPTRRKRLTRKGPLGTPR